MRKYEPSVTDARALVVSVNGAAAMLGSSRDRVYQLIRSRELDSYLDGTARRVTVASVQRYVDRKISGAFERAPHPQPRRGE
jgi:excisionase family DNA binding protein